MLRKILIGGAIFVFLTFLTVCAVVYITIKPGLRALRARNDALRQLQPGILLDQSQFQKTTFATLDNLGTISEITTGEPAKHENADLLVVGRFGAAFLKNSGTIVKQVSFSGANNCAAEVVELNDHAGYEFLARDESWFCDVALFDSSGKAKWTYHNRFGVNDSAVVHLPDGRLAIAVGLNGGGALVLLDENGKEIWQQEETNVWHVEALNVDGHDMIFHTNNRSRLLGRDTNGRTMADYLPYARVSYFSLTRWATEPTPTHLLIPSRAVTAGKYDSTVSILNSEGHEVHTLPVPMGSLFTRTRTSPVQFGENARYFGLIETAPRSRSLLILYNPALRLVYEELIDDACDAIGALPGPTGETLLVGCTNKVFEYRLNTPASASSQQSP